nr:phage portal protein [bacterium]
PGAVIRLEHPDAMLDNLEMKSDLASSIDLYRRLVSALHETTRIPEVATGKLDSAGQLSSLALRILYAPLLQKVESKRRTYGNGIKEMYRRALEIMGYEGVTVQVVWPDILPVDPEAMRRAALIDSQLGVSRTTLLEQLGYDAELEAEGRQDDQQEQAASFNAGFDAGL